MSIEEQMKVLRSAVIDLVDGQTPEDIERATGLSASRCLELYCLYCSLITQEGADL